MTRLALLVSLMGCATAPVRPAPEPVTPEVLAGYERYVTTRFHGAEALLREVEGSPAYSRDALARQREQVRLRLTGLDEEAMRASALTPAQLDAARHTGALEPQLRATKQARDALDLRLRRVQPVPLALASTRTAEGLAAHLSAAYARCDDAKVSAEGDQVRVEVRRCVTANGAVSGTLVFRLEPQGGLRVEAHQYVLGDLAFEGLLVRASSTEKGLRASRLTLLDGCQAEGKLEGKVSFSSAGKCWRDEQLEICSRPINLSVPVGTEKPRDHVPDPIGDALKDGGRALLALGQLLLALPAAAQQAMKTAFLSDPEAVAFASFCPTPPP